MIDCNAPDRTPRDIRTFKAIYKPHDVVCSTGGLPVIKLLCCHVPKMQEFTTSRWKSPWFR